MYHFASRRLAACLPALLGLFVDFQGVPVQAKQRPTVPQSASSPPPLLAVQPPFGPRQVTQADVDKARQDGFNQGKSLAVQSNEETQQKKINDQLMKQPSLNEGLSGYSDGANQISLDSTQKEDGIQKWIDAGKITTYHFGQTYLRVFVEYVYLPAEHGTTNSLSISVSTLNKTPLTFKSVVESQPNEVYSQRGQYFITPFFALNTKSPLEIRLEQRETRKEGTNAISFVQGLLTAAANVFTGGAASTVSALTNYANASNTVVGAYESNTTIADVNRKVMFDDVQADQMTLPTAQIAFFTRGAEAFDVVDKAGKHFALKESMPFKFKPSDEEATGQKSAYQFRLVTPDPKGGLPIEQTSSILYPAGKQAFVVLRFQVYTAYPKLPYYPDRVAGVREHFRALDALYLDRVINATQTGVPTPQTVAQATALPASPVPAPLQASVSTGTSDAGLNELFNLEGKKLFTDLRTLTDAGDISSFDAAQLLDEFDHRAQVLSNIKPGFLHTLTQSLYINETTDNLSYQNPLPAAPRPQPSVPSSLTKP